MATNLPLTESETLELSLIALSQTHYLIYQQIQYISPFNTDPESDFSSPTPLLKFLCRSPSCHLWTFAMAPYMICLLSHLIIPAFSQNISLKTDLVILVLKTLQGLSISFIAKFLTITHKDLPDLGFHNFSDLISYDSSPCSLCCRHTDFHS